MSKIEIENLSKSYDQKHYVLNGIDVTIEEGEFFVLVGPSGSGKSTLLRMIAGLEEISGGTLRMNGQEVNHLPPKQRNLSMVFQNYALYPHLTVEQNILFGLKAKRVSKEEQKKRLIKAADMMGLTDYLKRKPRQLSGGQRQRVALARAVVSDAPLCLMDEPLSNLDAKLRAQMRTEIRRLQRQLGLTMIYVTHDQIEAMTMGDRIMVLNDGKIQQVGNPIELYNEPANLFVASFIGSPRMNLGSAVLKGNVLLIENEYEVLLSDQTVHALPQNEPLTVGIRPEHLTPATGMLPSHQLETVNVEQLGNETLLTFAAGEQLWTAKWIGQHLIQSNETVSLHIGEEHLLFFHTESGELIRSAQQTNGNGAMVSV
ncbi:ABC transporter ATP-binding protein [Bacillus xiapuensis]|uniref:ABC transporter ATP-binding protein n=1 Tax=Bacillus xiapuensis TaxID=2014075 RepID=UPI000C24F6CA|nr:ABC transporter ATP-binding protein [Bacillus xiapuensis]